MRPPRFHPASLSPGNYGTLIVRTGGSRALSATGIYRFVSVLFEPDTKLMVAPGHTAIAVQGALPNQPSNMTLGPGQTTTSVGFCAHRNAPGAMATIVSASKK